jgi:hypothetical protein
MAEKLKFFHDQALIFIQSKDQLLNIVKDRLSGYQPDKPAKPANGWVRRVINVFRLLCI